MIPSKLSATEDFLGTLRYTYPDAWFMIVPNKTTKLNVPIIANYDPLHTETEPEFRTETIEIRQSSLVPSLWWGYGKETNRLAYWIEDNQVVIDMENQIKETSTIVDVLAKLVNLVDDAADEHGDLGQVFTPEYQAAYKAACLLLGQEPHEMLA